jgi:mannose-1-phosphate guanylyltransferase
MVLCAGQGTRLRPLTDELPKPLVPVGDRSVLEHVLDALAAAGFGRFVVNTHHRAADFDTFARPGLALSHEPAILGTAGGVAHAAAALGPGPVLVHNGDILADVDYPALSGSDAFAVLAVRPGRPVGEGTVGVDGGGRVVRLRGRTFGTEAGGADFAGVQQLSERARAVLPAAGCLVGDVYLPALARGEVLVAASVVRAFRDIGTVGEYLDANLAWLGERSAWIAPSATLAPGVAADRALVGAGAVIEGQGTVARTVVWPGARARAPLADAVVTASGRVVTRGTASPP